MKSPQPKRSRRLWLNIAALVASVGALGALAVFTGTPINAPRVPVTPQPIASTPPPSPIVHRVDALTPKTLAELLALPPEQLERVDIGLMNLLCATDLPGSEGLDIAAVLAKLDVWALAVNAETQRHLYRVTDPRYAEHYHHSESYLRVEFLLQTLQERCGVRYNPGSIYNPKFADSRDSFLHGLVDPQRGGTCASMPVLYVAVGRRLGYPIKLVQTRGHLFCRWDDPNGERFNIEGTNGFSSYPDEFYRKWPYGLTDDQLASREYLVSLTPAEELAGFMASRGHCYMDLQRFPEAVAAYREMARLAPTFKVQGEFLPMAQLAADRGLAEYERVYGQMPEQMEPPPPPPVFVNTDRGGP